MNSNKEEVLCGCSIASCLRCKKETRKKAVADFNQTLGTIKNFVSDLFLASKPASPPKPASVPPVVSEKALALAYSRIEDLKQQNEVLKRKICALEGKSPPL
jgi:hypothetical protein